MLSTLSYIGAAAPAISAEHRARGPLFESTSMEQARGVILSTYVRGIPHRQHSKTRQHLHVQSILFRAQMSTRRTAPFSRGCWRLDTCSLLTKRMASLFSLGRAILNSLATLASSPKHVISNSSNPSLMGRSRYCGNASSVFIRMRLGPDSSRCVL